LKSSQLESNGQPEAKIAKPNQYNTNTSNRFGEGTPFDYTPFTDDKDLMPGDKDLMPGDKDLMQNNPEESMSKETQKTQEQMSFEKIENDINYGDEYVEHKMFIEELNKFKNLSQEKFEKQITFLLNKYPNFEKDIETIPHENNNQYIGELVQKYKDDSTNILHKLKTLNKSVSHLKQNIHNNNNTINEGNELFTSTRKSLKENHNLIYELLFNEDKLKTDAIKNIMLLSTKVKAEFKKAKDHILLQSRHHYTRHGGSRLCFFVSKLQSNEPSA
jgi:hypothetical protein